MQETKPKLYITGIAGLLGANLAYELKNLYQIAGVDINPIQLDSVHSEVFDVLNYSLLEKQITSFKPDIIIHTIAAVNVDLCEEKPHVAKQLNVDLTSFLTSLCEKLHIHLIYISTDAVFDGQSEKPYEESDAPNPINIYAKTKFEAENIVRSYQNSLVVRTNIYGFNVQNKQSFGEWILDGLHKDEELSMFTDIDFSPILVNDLAWILHASIKKNLTGIYHICGTGFISKYDFGCLVKQIFGIKTGIIKPSLSKDHTFIAKRSKHMGMSNAAICKETGERIRTPKESIIHYKELYDLGLPNNLKKLSNLQKKG